LESAKKWLTSTFLYIRLQANPNHYKLDDRISESNIDARLENICCRDLDLLRESEMVAGDTRLESTAYGEAMARCCVRFETAKGFLALPKNATISEMVCIHAIEVRNANSDSSLSSPARKNGKTCDSAVPRRQDIKI
jgi:ATP-dependent DNA helicase HFM1/MER3